MSTLTCTATTLPFGLDARAIVIDVGQNVAGCSLLRACLYPERFPHLSRHARTRSVTTLRAAIRLQNAREHRRLVRRLR